MTASANIKTPTMEVPLKSGKKALKKARKLKIKFAKVTVAQVSLSFLMFSIILTVVKINAGDIDRNLGNTLHTLHICKVCNIESSILLLLFS